jgi:hypothetical protein
MEDKMRDPEDGRHSAWAVAAAILYLEYEIIPYTPGMHLDQLADYIIQTNLSDLGSRRGKTPPHKTLRSQLGFDAPLLPGVDSKSTLMFRDTGGAGCALNNPKLAVTHPDVAKVLQILAQRKTPYSG